MRISDWVSVALELRGSDPRADWQRAGSGVCLHVIVTRLFVVLGEFAKVRGFSIAREVIVIVKKRKDCNGLRFLMML